MSVVVDSVSLEILQLRFLTLLPRVEMHGRICFRHLKCHARKADAIQEMRALAWKWFLRLAHRGKDPADFLFSFTTFLARSVNCGRRLAGMENSKDAMCPAAQRQRGFVVGSLPGAASLGPEILSDALCDNTMTPPADAAGFRIDFPRWLEKHSRRDRRIIYDLMMGERTGDVARKFSLSPPRISQLRKELQQDWVKFCADPSGRPCDRSDCGPVA